MAKVQFNPVREIVKTNWLGEFLDNNHHVVQSGGRVNPALFAARGDVGVKLTANAAQGATALVVQPLSGPVAAGALLYFGEAGEYARVAADAAADATSLTVDALPTAVESGDRAVYAAAGGDRRVYIPDGTLVGRVRGTRLYGPADVDAHDEIGFNLRVIDDANANQDFEILKPGPRTIRYQFLPGWSALPAATQNWIHANYHTITVQS